MLFKTVLQNYLTTWVLLAAPALPFLQELWLSDGYTPQLLHETGLWSVWLLIIALSITPLTRLLRAWHIVTRLLGVLRKRRRAIGVASFGYAFLHVIFYIRDIADIELIALEALDLRLAFGWLVFLALGIGAATSNEFAQRKLGAKWKSVQRNAYLAALLTGLHWWWIEQFLDQLVLWALVLAALQLLRNGVRPTRSALPAGTDANRSGRPYKQ